MVTRSRFKEAITPDPVAGGSQPGGHDDDLTWAAVKQALGAVGKRLPEMGEDLSCYAAVQPLNPRRGKGARMTRLVAALVLAAGLIPPLSAQNTFYVGPGEQFAEIQPAIDAASPGDRVIVSNQDAYSGFVITKPLSIVGGGAQLLFGNAEGETVTIRDVPAGDVVVRGFHVLSFNRDPSSIRHCQARVLIDELHGQATGLLTIEDSAQVLINRSTLGGGMDVTRSVVTIANASISASTAPTGLPGPAFHITDAQVVLAASRVVGGSAVFFAPPPGPAIELDQAAVVTILGSASSIESGQSTATQPVSAIVGNGSVVIDPDVALVPFAGAPPIAATVAATFAQRPSLSAQGGALGGMSTVGVEGEPGDSYFLFIGLPGNAVPLPAFRGSIWINLQTLIVAGVGTLDSGGQAALSFGVPNDEIMLGVPIHWLALTAGAGAPLLTNNVGYSHG